MRWGDQSWQEMLVAQLAVIVDRGVDPKTVAPVGVPGVTDVDN